MNAAAYAACCDHMIQQSGSDWLRFVMRTKWRLLTTLSWDEAAS